MHFHMYLHIYIYIYIYICMHVFVFSTNRRYTANVRAAHVLSSFSVRISGLEGNGLRCGDE